MADATAPQSDAFRAMQKAKSVQEEAAPELLPASDGWVHPHPTWIASQAIGSTPLVLKAGPGDIEAIPTLSQWSLILLTGLLGAVSFWQTRNRKA
ncbi:MAG: IPTL-CTERM sorting domain-containing protein [Comamonadaceae bacterium]|nr:MAG: IPTL-CTERM sorting domain-containing protein [Comamonadaceae bacterium]